MRIDEANTPALLLLRYHHVDPRKIENTIEKYVFRRFENKKVNLKLSFYQTSSQLLSPSVR